MELEAEAVEQEQSIIKRQEAVAVWASRAAVAEAEIERWKHSFDGHLYVTEDDYSALVKRAKSAEANQRTPGTVEVCERCGRNAGYYGPTCRTGDCPLRAAKDAT